LDGVVILDKLSCNIWMLQYC